LLAFLEQAQNTSLLIQIALDEGDIDQALQRLQGTATTLSRCPSQPPMAFLM
jgi:hypothetical protein